MPNILAKSCFFDQYDKGFFRRRALYESLSFVLWVVFSTTCICTHYKTKKREVLLEGLQT